MVSLMSTYENVCDKILIEIEINQCVLSKTINKNEISKYFYITDFLLFTFLILFLEWKNVKI